MPVATVPTLPSFAELESAAELVHRFVPPTPQYSWPLLNQRAGCEVWMKHENHTPVGAFKVRGGIVYMDWLRRAHPETRGVISATRGNHGQSQAFAARQFGRPSGGSKRARAEDQYHRRGVSKRVNLCVIVCGRARGGAEVRDAHCRWHCHLARP